MILKSSPVRKSRASLGTALRALMVSACALTAPTAFGHANKSRRPVPAPSPATHPYLALLAPTPLRFLPAERPPAVLAIEPTAEELAAQAEAAQAEAETQAANQLITEAATEFRFDFNLPSSSELDATLDDIAEEARAAESARDSGPPPILLPAHSIPGTRPEDVLPFFRLPSNPSKASYRKE